MIAGVVGFFPDLAEVLSWRRSLPFLLRLSTAFTGHLAHWSLDHLAWDLAAFAALACAAIRLAPGRVVPCLLFAGFAIPLEISLLQTQFESYRGLSGLDSALFGLVLAALWRNGGTARALSALGLAAFFGKIGYEFVTGDTLFVEREAGDFIPVVSAHVVGLLVGWLCGLVRSALNTTPPAIFCRSPR